MSEFTRCDCAALAQDGQLCELHTRLRILQSRSGEMADTEDLKSSEVKPHGGSSPSSGISELVKAHEALLNTLGASNNLWIKMVHKNASAYFKTWKEKNGFF